MTNEQFRYLNDFQKRKATEIILKYKHGCSKITQKKDYVIGHKQNVTTKLKENK